jgi:two-component system, NarL family, sensor histidine kinase DesK
MTHELEDSRPGWRSRASVGLRTLLLHQVPNRCGGRVWAWAAPAFGLLWLALPTVDFASSEPSAWQVALVSVGLPVFAYAFFAVTTMERPLREPLIAMLVISVALTVAALDSFGLLFVYAASAASVRLAGRTSVLAVAAITALAAATLAVTNPEAGVFWGVTATVFATGTLWFLIGGLLRANAELREARSELAELAVADERLRFARDLHDLLGHDLSLIALKAELAGKLLPTGAEAAATEVDDIKDLTRNALGQVREAVDGYRRPTLAGELAGARVALEAAGIDLRVDDRSDALDPDVESVLAWAVREGATNVIRHSGARHAAIKIGPGGEVEITDDGQGERGVNGSEPDPGHGLDGLLERARSIGGGLEAGAGPEGGFRLRVSVPAQDT